MSVTSYPQPEAHSTSGSGEAYSALGQTHIMATGVLADGLLPLYNPAWSPVSRQQSSICHLVSSTE